MQRSLAWPEQHPTTKGHHGSAATRAALLASRSSLVSYGIPIRTHPEIHVDIPNHFQNMKGAPGT